VPGEQRADEQVTRTRLAGFRKEFYACLPRRADALFELADAVLCAPGPVTSLPELSLAFVPRRGHGALYDGLACGEVDLARLRVADAECSPGRLHCHRPCRCDGIRQTIPGWPYSMVVALESGRSSWTAPLDAVRVGPDDDVTEVTAAQLREVIDRLHQAGQCTDGDPPVPIVTDSGYDIVRLAWLLADLPVQLLGRVRADRVFYAPPGTPHPHGGRPRRHAHPLKLSDPASWPEPEATSTSTSDRYGTVVVNAYGRRHQRLTRRGDWHQHPGLLPIVEGTLIQVRVDRLPGQRAPKPLWLWHSHPDPVDLDLVRIFAAFCRRYDAEHTFRFCKQTLGWTRPRVRNPAQADRWTWLILAAYAQLRLARALAGDLRRPWQPALTTDRLTPGRVRRGFPRIQRTTTCPSAAPKPSTPGPGRPKGSTSPPTQRHPVGKTTVKPHNPKRRRKKRPDCREPGSYGLTVSGYRSASASDLDR
jgi:hypothetical protein